MRRFRLPETPFPITRINERRLNSLLYAPFCFSALLHVLYRHRHRHRQRHRHHPECQHLGIICICRWNPQPVSACLPVVPGPTNKRPTWHTPRRPTVTTAVYRAQARDWEWGLAHSFSITHRRRQPACWWRHLRRATFTQAWGIRQWAEPWLLVSTVPDYLIIYCNLCPLPVCSFAFARLLSFSLADPVKRGFA